MHNTKEKQYHIALGSEDIGKYVILPGDPARVPMIANFFDNPKKVAQNREYTTFTGTLLGEKVSCLSTGIGCPSAAIALEELVEIGAETFIRVGTAGAMQRQINLGEIVISTASVREEGTTPQYVPLSYPAVADLDITLALRKAAKSLKIPYHEGITHCKDAFFIEHDNKIPWQSSLNSKWEAFTNANVLATSMEDAALFVISSIRKVKCGEVLAIIGQTFDHNPIAAGKHSVEPAIKTAIEALKILIKEKQS